MRIRKFVLTVVDDAEALDNHFICNALKEHFLEYCTEPGDLVVAEVRCFTTEESEVKSTNDTLEEWMDKANNLLDKEILYI